jgi:3-deoxy-D-manno-octulosonic-acid transferase
VPSKSFPRAARLSRLVGHPVAQAAAVFAKSEHIAQRFKALGAEPVFATGETRFDIPPPAQLIEAGRAIGQGRPVLTLASVVAGEEEVYLRAIREVLEGPDAPLVVWVPRAPEKFEAHAERLAAEGFRVLRRTDAFDDDLRPTADLAEAQILVGNSLGEMFFYLAPADAVIVGGGFIEKGAHNVIEPLSLGKPVITGPHVWTIEYPAVEAEAADVLTVVRQERDLVPAIRDAMQGGASRAEAFHAANQGASARIYAAIRPLLEARP